MDRERLQITTPEGLTLGMDLATLGSRGTAAAIDTAIQFGMMLGLGLIAAVATDAVAQALATIGVFVVFFGYHPAFEIWNAGRTPGKRALRIRVVRTDGGPVGVAPAAIRSILRLVDLMPLAYAVGMISVASTARSQRIGDLAAGTVVVHDAAEPPAPPVSTWTRAEPDRDLSGWDASLVTREELALVRRFLGRRFQIQRDSRNLLATRLADHLDVRVRRPDERITAESFLEHVVAAKEYRDR